jgi:hypothetical protein
MPQSNVINVPIILAIRTGDVFTVEKWDGTYNLNESTYAVALFKAPDLKELKVPISEVAGPTGVVAAGVTLDGWGWISLDPITKDYIGNILEEVGARLGEWFKLTITYANPLNRAKAIIENT